MPGQEERSSLVMKVKYSLASETKLELRTGGPRALSRIGQVKM